MLWIMAWMALGLYVACFFGAAASHMGKDADDIRPADGERQDRSLRA